METVTILVIRTGSKNMDELIKRIISIINEREQNTLVLSCRTPSLLAKELEAFYITSIFI